MNELHLIALANLLLCLPVIVICLCRLNAMGTDVRLAVRIEYAVGVGAMFASIARPWWGEWPGYASLCVAAYVLLQLIASTPAWRGDKAPQVATDKQPPNAVPAPTEVPE